MAEIMTGYYYYYSTLVQLLVRNFLVLDTQYTIVIHMILHVLMMIFIDGNPQGHSLLPSMALLFVGITMNTGWKGINVIVLDRHNLFTPLVKLKHLPTCCSWFLCALLVCCLLEVRNITLLVNGMWHLCTDNQPVT